MKTNILTSLAIGIFLGFASCNVTEDPPQAEQEKLKSHLVFYTNAQAFIDNAQFGVNVFIDSVLAGNVPNPYIGDGLPECILSDNTLLIAKDSGTYNYYATTTFSNCIQWTGTIHAKPDSCYKIFLDIKDAEGLTEKGSIVFYTNIQALTNCGPYNVYVFVDNDSIGLIEYPSSGDPDPDCIASNKTVVLKKNQEFIVMLR